MSTIFVEPDTANGVEAVPAGLAADVMVAETAAPCDSKLRLGFPSVGAAIATLVAPAGIVTAAVSLERRLTWATGAAVDFTGGATYFDVVTESDEAETFEVPSAVVAVTVNEYVVSSARFSIERLSSPQVYTFLL